MGDFLANLSPAAYCNIGNISLCFYTKYCAGTPSQTIPSTYVSNYQIQNTSGSLTEVVKTTALAYYDPANPQNPLNKTTLDSLATQFGTDYSNWKQYTFDYVFAGIAAIAPNGLIDVIEFKYISEREPCVTRFYSYPLNFTIQNMGHYDYKNDCPNSTDTGVQNWDQRPYITYFGPPASCSGSTLQLSQYGLILADGRLGNKYIGNYSL